MRNPEKIKIDFTETIEFQCDQLYHFDLEQGFYFKVYSVSPNRKDIEYIVKISAPLLGKTLEDYRTFNSLAKLIDYINKNVSQDELNLFKQEVE